MKGETTAFDTDDDFLYTEYCDGAALGALPLCPPHPSGSFFGAGDNSTGAGACYCRPAEHMDIAEFRSWHSVHQIWHILCTIMPLMAWFAIARLATRRVTGRNLRYGIEFLVIMVPSVVSVNVANAYVEYFCGLVAVAIGVVMWRRQCWAKAKWRHFEWGHRPHVFTLLRTTTNLLTALCILAIDFASFPRHFRKSRRYGVGLMDVGIGLFASIMGMISRPPRTRSDFVKVLKVVVPTLVLGAARTIVIVAIDYHQDEHEYGVHMNAFFTLGLTKLFGSLISCLARSDNQLLIIAAGIAVAHEVVLEHGLNYFVMNPFMPRDTLLRANREGLCSLPGFIAIYLIIMYVGKRTQAADSLTYREFMHKLKVLTASAAGLWLLLLGCVFTVGIARVTCNLGYVIWMVAITVTMMVLAMLIFDVFLNTLWPEDGSVHDIAEQGGGGGDDLQPLQISHSKMKLQSLRHDQRSAQTIPSLVEALNYNGLVYFLISNVLTGLVNMKLAPDDRSTLEGVIILCIYMFVTSTVVYALYRSKVRIA